MDNREQKSGEIVSEPAYLEALSGEAAPDEDAGSAAPSSLHPCRSSLASEGHSSSRTLNIHCQPPPPTAGASKTLPLWP